MMRTRLVIPTGPELTVPHFEDEATIVSARPVVPIARARRAERSRFLLFVVPAMLAAVVFGAVGALGVNYLRNHPRGVVAVTSQPEAVQQPPAKEVPVSQSPVSAPAGAEQGGALASDAAEIASVPDSLGPTAATTVDVSTAPATVAKPAANDYKSSEPTSDPSRLVRKRRVLPPIERNVPSPRPLRHRERGAARIQEIFEGPNL